MTLRARLPHGLARLIGVAVGVAFLLLELLVDGLLRRQHILSLAPSAYFVPLILGLPWFVYRLVWSWSSCLRSCPSGCGRLVSVRADYCGGCGLPLKEGTR